MCAELHEERGGNRLLIKCQARNIPVPPAPGGRMMGVSDQREAPNPLVAGEPAMPVSQAAVLLGHAGTSALRKRLMAGTLRGLAPYSDGNPSREWVVSRSQVETEAANRGRAPIAAQAEEPLLADLRAEMLQGALSEEKDRRIADLERRL